MNGLMDTFIVLAIASCIVGVIASALTEVLKNVIKYKSEYSINLTVLVISELLIYLVYFIWLDKSTNVIIWYDIVIAGICGLVATGVAIQGFDKFFKPVWEKIKDILNYFGK